MAELKLEENEEQLVKEVRAILDSQDQAERELFENRINCIYNLGKVVSSYPSVRESTILQGTLRDEQQLLNALCSFGSASRLLYVPSRVVLTRSFLVAKFQAFSMISILIKEHKDFINPLRNIMNSIIHTLMTEEVYFSCLDDPDFTHDIKMSVAHDLITLWDSGTDPRLVQHLPSLDALWTARDKSPPAFGTMTGSSELIRITIDLGDDWQEFLVDHTSIDETRWALEEFLFGLSYEEIRNLRSRLVSSGITAVGHEEVRSHLGEKPAYGIVKSTDYRAVYDFYVGRRDTAIFRQRSHASGPHRTLEEIYLKYRIARE